MKQDEGVDIAVEIVSEITELAWTVVHEHMIEEQSFAFACERATEEMLQIVEWHYLSRDDGELNTTTDPSWNEDNGILTLEHAYTHTLCYTHTRAHCNSHIRSYYRTTSCSDRYMGTRYHTTHC